MAFELKFSKFDNTPWGFRLTGGCELGLPLTVIKVTEGSLSEKLGLWVNDVILKINEIDTTALTHDEAHDVILKAGNNFVATVLREACEPEIQEICMMAATQQANSMAAPLVNGVHQVPAWYTCSTKVSSKVYKPFKNFPDIPPLENPLILSPKYAAQYQTDQQQQQELKEAATSSRHTSSSSMKCESTQNQKSCNSDVIVKDIIAIKEIEDTVDTNKFVKNIVLDEKIDIKEIEECAKLIVNENCEKSLEKTKNIQIHKTAGQRIIPITIERDEKTKTIKIENKNEKQKKTKKEVVNKEVVNKEVVNKEVVNKEVVNKEVVNKEVVNKEVVNKDVVNKKEERHDMSLKDAKIKAMRAANVLSQQAKLNGVSTFEGKKTGTVNTFNEITQTMKTSCFQVPCDAAQLKTQRETDILLKTFFIHLTDVMVALTRMINSESSAYCSCICNMNCTCRQPTNEVTVGTKKSVEEKEVKTSNVENTGHVLKQVIENIQSATGVDVTVNGKDPLEWLSDLDELEKTKSSQREILETTTEQKLTETSIGNTESETNLEKNVQEISSVAIQEIESKVEENITQQENICIENKVSEIENIHSEVAEKEVVNEEQINMQLEESHTAVTKEDITIVQSEIKSEEQEKNSLISIESSESKTVIEQTDLSLSSFEETNQQIKQETISEEFSQKQEFSTEESKISTLEKTEVQEIKQVDDEKFDINKIAKNKKRESAPIGSPGWDVKVIPNNPMTPNTDEYLFRLDVKFKGKLRDCPEYDMIREEPLPKPEIKPVPKKPTFSIGNVKIESSQFKENQNTDIVKPTTLDVKSVLDEDFINASTNSTQNNNTSNAVNDTTASSNIFDSSVANNLSSVINEKSTNQSTISHDSTKTNGASNASNAANSITSKHIEIVPDSESNSNNDNHDSIKGIVSSISTTAINQDGLISRHDREHESIVTQQKDEVTNYQQEQQLLTTSLTSSQSINNTLASEVITNGIDIIKHEENVIESEEVKNTLNSENIKQEIFENGTIAVENEACDEIVTTEAAPQTLTMGEQAKSFATVVNGVQTINSSVKEQLNGFTDFSNNEEVGKPGLDDNEIASIVTGNAQEIKEQHVVGLQKVLASHMNRPEDEINKTKSPDMTPIVGFLRDSEVFKALNEENLKLKAERLQEERRKFTTFLQRPDRPIPYCKRTAEQLVFEDPPYKVNIKKQPKKEDEPTSSILSEGVFLIEEAPILIPEPTPQYYEAPEYLADTSFPDLEDTGIPLPPKPEPIVEEEMISSEEIEVEHNEENGMNEELTNEAHDENPVIEEVEAMVCDESNDENLSVEEQLAKVQKQLIVLSKLPATIQQTLDLVTKQLSKMVPKPESELNQENEENGNNDNMEVSTIEENGDDDNKNTENSHEEIITEDNKNEIDEHQNNNEQSIDANGEQKKEMDAEDTNVNSNHDTNESKMKNGSSIIQNGQKSIQEMKQDVINELNGEHAMRQVKQRPTGRVGRPKPAFGPLTPQERPIVLPGGKRWKIPQDVFTDSFIAETLSGQAEVIMGTTLGNHFKRTHQSFYPSVNFMKYAKPPPPIPLGHLKDSSVFKMVHDMDEPPKGIYERPPIVMAESEFREKCRSVTPSSFDKGEMQMETES